MLWLVPTNECTDCCTVCICSTCWICQSVCVNYLDTGEHRFVFFFVSWCKCIQVQEFNVVLQYTRSQRTSTAPCQNQDVKHRDRETREGRKSRRERNWDVGPQRCLWFYITGYLQLCRYVFVRHWQWTSWLGWRLPNTVWELSGWAVLMVALGYWKEKGMCVWARNSCSLRVMTTFGPSVWFMDVRDLSSLQDLWQDMQDAVNVLNTPYDRCVHLVCKDVLWRLM